MKNIVVIGNGMVGYKFLEKFVAKAPQNEYQLIVFGEEPRIAYDRVHLSAFFDGKSADDLSMSTKEWYVENNIQLYTSELVIAIDRTAKTVTTHNHKTVSYDYLVFATGSAPFVPPIKDIDKEGGFVYRTIEDLEAITDYAKKIKAKGKTSAAVLGGGLLGLEAAKAVRDLNLTAHVVEFAPRLMPRQLDDQASKALQSEIESLGIKIHLSKSTDHIIGDEAIVGMQFSDDTKIDVDMLVVSAGIIPRDELAKASGLPTGVRGGIVVNNQMKTEDESIFAIGEVALFTGKIFGLVAPGYDMAEVAVCQILGENKVMPDEIDMSTQLKLIGVDVCSFGDAQSEFAPAESIVYNNKSKKLYKRINISEDGKRLLGGILVGDAKDYNLLYQMYLNGMKLPENPESLILGSTGGEGFKMSVLDLPDAAVICSCESVTKGQICGKVQSGECCTTKEIAKSTKATTGCGGCKPMVNDLVNETLKSMGVEVKETICEHFEYSRQELYDLIKVKGIHNYDHALDTIGKGHGCEVCKPALASLFASIYNETPNKQEAIQDTNDRFLANIQRNGTYSVVPRIAGGEITPDKVIVIGEVAKKYNLYTKITGGQRIDLFGARLDQLPSIWKELIDAGFESGHAYGKSLRTVKSCVGSTWCRYGMDESVSFAIEIEDRYKGIRSPHKLKGGVSGCIRECAEARCKDFGLIATEQGWNLYICGNGGANPKHGVLFAEQIDNATAIKYLDRFLMYYIKTASPLTRTSVWLEKLEGGIEHVKDVVINDSLGICTELETEIQGLIDTYKCEWKEAIENESVMKRYKHFVNSEETDDNIVFVPMRDQMMPKAW